MSAPAHGLATPAEVAAWLGISVEALKKRRTRGTGPRWFYVGRSVRYAWGDVQRWVLDHQAGAKR